jgi:DNA repair exonuclease SbcCD ATPase subunit
VKSTYDKEYVETIKKQIEKEDEKITKIKEKLAEIENDKKHYEYLGECCSNKSSGFKKFFIGEMIPVFNEKINQYLPFFFNDNKMEVSFDKDLNDTIKKDGKEITFSSLSCGQKTRMEIAAAFALFGLSRVFFSNQSGLLIVDELVDRGMDEFGIKSAISILESFAEDSKVYIISHNPTVKENINDVIEVKTDENGFSYIIDK